MPRHRRFTTPPTEDLDSPERPEDRARFAALAGAATAGARAILSPAHNDDIIGWPAALILHASIIALALISFEPRLSLEPPSPQGVSVVFQNSGTTQTALPPAPLTGPPQVLEAPPPAAPPPPPQAAQTQLPEVNLNLPMQQLEPLTLPPPAAQSQPSQQRHVAIARPTHHQYQVMNNMSLGTAASPPMPNARPGLNLQLSQSDLSQMNAPEITVQGEIGSDWMSGFNKWVNEHIYYPQAAIEQNQQGTSTIEFTVHRDGSVTGVHLLTSAGSPFLDQAWLGIFLQNNVPPFPPGTRSDTIKITAALQYELIH